MFRIKVLNKKNHPFTGKIKVYGISIEAILITAFIAIVLFLTGVYMQNKKQKNTVKNKSISVLSKAILNKYK